MKKWDVIENICILIFIATMWWWSREWWVFLLLIATNGKSKDKENEEDL